MRLKGRSCGIMIKKLKEKIVSSDLGYRLAKGISWSLISSAISKGLMLISFMLIARILGKEEYGKVGIIRSSITMFMTFSSMGMGLTASRYIAYFRNTDQDKTYQIYKVSNLVALLFGLMISLIVFIFSQEISIISFGTAKLSVPLKISTLSLLFMTISSAQNGALTGFEDFKSIGIDLFYFGILQSLLIISGAYFAGINGVIFALGISAFFLCLLYRNSLKKHFKHLSKPSIRNILNKEIKSIFFHFSIPSVLSGIVSLPILWWSKTLLVRNSGFEEMAIYDVAEQWNMMLLFIPSSISGIILPLLTNVLSVGTQNQYKKLINVNLLINGGITLLLALVIIPFAPYILKLYGNNFTNYIPLRIMLLTAVLQAINAVLGQVIASKGKMWIGFGVNLLWGMWLIIFSFIFIRQLSMNAIGLSYAILISYILHSIVQGFIATKIKI